MYGTNHPHCKDHDQKGVVLITTFGIIIVVSILGLTLFSLLQFDIGRTQFFEARTRASYLARAGVEAAIENLRNDLNEWDSLNDSWALDQELFRNPKLYSRRIMTGQKRSGITGGYDVTPQYNATGEQIRGIVDEESKVKLVPEMAEVIVRLLGMPQPAVLKMIKSRDFSTISPDKLQYLTFYGHGKINLNTAQYTILACVPLLTPELAQAIVDYRSGADRISGSEDDQIFKTVDDLRWIPGFSENLVQRLSPYFAVHSTTFMIRSVGRVVQAGESPMESHITAIVNRESSPIQTIFWLQN